MFSERKGGDDGQRPLAFRASLKAHRRGRSEPSGVVGAMVP
jgi:hypothetical protein